MIHDYLIVGRGIAGSILANQLHQAGASVAVIDEAAVSTSSRVAAGLANPFTGPKMVKSWKAEILFPFMEAFYKELQERTGTKFFYERTLYRPFASAADLNDWYGRSATQSHSQFIIRILGSGGHGNHVDDPHGGVEIRAFVLDVPAFLDAVQALLGDVGCQLTDTFFEEDRLEIKGDRVTFGQYEARRLVMCNGYKVRDSKYFGWLPITPVKGEILKVEMAEDFETIYNRSCFIIPQADGTAKVGSTYDRSDMTEKATEKGKNVICEKLESLSLMPYKIVGHSAGVRPGTVPRRPLMGVHPEHDKLFVFNGLGTKGVSLAPYFANEFTKYLQGDNNLEGEVNIEKYYSLYFKAKAEAGK
jgi:glycine oxidase